jgi:hypothetical protein
MDTKKEQKKSFADELHYTNEGNLRTILRDAIRMQALYSGRRITIVESSKQTN